MNNYFIPAVNTSSQDPLSAMRMNGIDPYKIASGQQYVDPKLFQLYLTASMTNMDMLLNDNSNSDNNNNSSDIFSNITGTSQSPFQQTASTFPSSQSVYEQMIAQSGLIGKTVSAKDPETNQVFSGKVSGVTVESGKLQIVVDGKAIAPENLISVKE